MKLHSKVKCQEARWKSSWTVVEAIKIRLWAGCWLVLASWTPKWFRNWRVLLLRMFGAKIVGRPYISSSMRVYAPWNLEFHKSACVAPRVDVYSLGRIVLRERCVVCQDVMLCGGSHDLSSRRLPLLIGDIDIGPDAFIGARAIILPGVTIGEGAVVGAGAVVTRDVAPWTMVAGNPAKVIGHREFKD